MKKLLPLAIICTLFTPISHGKTIFSDGAESENTKKTPPKEIVDFIFNDPSISKDDLQLRQEQILECLKDNNLKKSDLPKLMSAVKIPLGSGGASNYYFARGGDYCSAFYRAHIFQYWIIKTDGKERKILFNNSSDGVDVLSSESNGMKDIEVMNSIDAGSELRYEQYKFDGNEYVLSECFSEKNTDSKKHKRKKISCSSE